MQKSMKQINAFDKKLISFPCDLICCLDFLFPKFNTAPLPFFVIGCVKCQTNN